ncbi:MAG: serine/threonine protein kinase [Clostridiales bacterium]|nr:serine/threonine protein kinase [Clostridiales bacterium]
MNLSDELALSYYKTVADIDTGHSVQLVQHIETKKFFVKKHLTVYHLDIYQALQAAPIRNTPRIFLLAEDETGLTIIEEYLPGDTLQELVERDGPQTEEQVLNYTLQLCQIVSDLHHREPPIIHRDIKPSNVILSPDGVIKLLDMNAAKYVTPSQTRDTMLIGTAGFAAPEQYGFGPSGVQSDLFAVGVLMNVLATGGLPAERKAEGKLAPIIQKCIELDPANRYGSIDDLQTELAQLQAKSGNKTATDKEQTWRRSLPPGFRSGSVTHMAIAVIGYAAIIFVGWCMELENTTPFALTLNRLAVILIELAVLFFSADYRGIQARLPLTRSKNRVVHLVGIAFYDIVIAFMLFMILIIFDSGL